MRIAIGFVCVLFFSMLGVAHAEHSSNQWKKIDVAPGVYTVRDGNGAERQIRPSCSGGPVCTRDATTGQTTCRPGDTDYSFYYKRGKSSKLLVFFDGGGACWDSTTCVTGNLTPVPAYVPELGPGSDPATKGGLFNLQNADNPYRDWSMVYVPYCTADVHWGSRDQTYLDFTGAATGTPGGTITLHHRGFDNFLYVREWIKHRFGEDDDEIEAVKKLLVVGSSAGAYGAAFAYPHLRKMFPRAKAYALADGGNGVMTDSFLNQAVKGVNASWGVEQNLATWIPGITTLGSQSAGNFLNAYYFALTGYHSRDRFAEYTTTWDVAQAVFYNIMLNQSNIAAWLNLSPAVYGAWTGQMVNNIYTRNAIPNYRFYVAEGCNHTVLRYNDDFYKPASNQDIAFLDWFGALTRGRSSSAPTWQSSFCQNCTVPPTLAQVNACLMRSIAP